MNQLIIFNHLSLPYATSSDADAAIPLFLKICLQAGQLGLSVILFDEEIDKTWFKVELVHGYYFHDWYNKNKNDENKDLIRAFRNIQTRQPFFPRDLDTALFDVVLPSDESRNIATLKAARWYEAPIVSFPVGVPWNVSPIQALLQTLDAKGKLESKEIDIINLYSLAVLHAWESILRKQQEVSLVKGCDIVENMKANFPGVVLCGKAEEQLLSGAYPPLIFEQIKESFSALSRFAMDWHLGSVKQYTHEALSKYDLSYEISGESDSVMSNRELKKLREFWLPTGEKVCFENHIKFRYKKFRLHFYPAVEEKIIYVGYIGSHMLT
ncbi:hypothetical protein SDC9_04323 [bioreactor metagenome]|uniref:Uncharacterized protein n=1 Tax=bioreactor metagenome TaxID=1076179 RepID=A0A644SYR0_9ZZZZ